MSRTVGKKRGQRRIKTRGKYKKKRRNSQKKRNGTNKRTRTKSKWIGGDVTKEYKVLKGFEDFVTITIKDIERIGNNSLNGYVLKVLTPGKSEYNIDRLIPVENYTDPDPESTILKIPRDEVGQLVVDNLDYEHKVGLYINELMKYYPCFVKTMDFYEIENKKIISSYFKNFKYLTEKEKKRRLDMIGESIQKTAKNYLDVSDEGCGNKKNRALQLQYVNGQTLADIIKTLPKEEKYGILLQVYGPLYNLSDNLPEDNDKPNSTGRRKLLEHKDLHQNNVLVVKLPKPIKMVYKFDFDVNGEKEITICTKYIAKIIDYGRCYIPSTEYFYTEMNNILDIKNEDERSNKKKQYKKFLNSCGLKHILYPYPDFNMYNKIDCDICKNNKTVLEDIIDKLKPHNSCKEDKEEETSVSNFSKQFTITIDCSTQDIKKQQQMKTEGKLKYGIDETILIDDRVVDPKQNLEESFKATTTPRKP